jgi:hypothetical protein
MITANVDTSRLFQVMKQFSKESRKDLGTVVQERGAIMVAHLIAYTPPGASRGQALGDRGGINAKVAKGRGESSIAADIAALFPPAPRGSDEKIQGMMDSGFEFGTGRGKKIIKQHAKSLSEMKRIHDAARSKSSGRVRTGSVGQSMALAKKSLRNQYIKQAKKKVGILNAGWLRAARKLKTAKRNTPAWITRHGQQAGGVDFRHSKSGLTITVSNGVQYFPKNMTSRIDRVVNRGVYGLEKALENMIARNAAKATQRMK